MGDPRSVPEIGAALELFDRWERAPGDPGAADLFARALEHLDDCEEPEHHAFIRNVRLANTRRLLNQLSRVRVSDLANWAGYGAILQSSAEAQTVIAEHPDLRKVLDAFLDAHI
ncbi:MAG TPA: hypothetical protein VFK84_18610 [Burkholderiales bacterium]|nr:hypothetical protein [Burkholderiales bacterium]